MTEKNEPTFEEFKEKGIPMEDYCDVCDNGSSLLYKLNKGRFVYYCCDKCKMVTSH